MKNQRIKIVYKNLGESHFRLVAKRLTLEKSGTR